LFESAGFSATPVSFWERISVSLRLFVVLSVRLSVANPTFALKIITMLKTNEIYNKDFLLILTPPPLKKQNMGWSLVDQYNI
jgi:hypothetical protein